MVQHIIIKYDHTTQVPYIEPYYASIWRNDQIVQWFFDPAYRDMWWEAGKAEPIVFLLEGGGVSAWPGSVPAGVGPKPPEKDRRPYFADGGRPNLGTTVITYRYDAYLEWITETGEHRKLKLSEALAMRKKKLSELKEAPIDPDILNRPLP